MEFFMKHNEPIIPIVRGYDKEDKVIFNDKYNDIIEKSILKAYKEAKGSTNTEKCNSFINNLKNNLEKEGLMDNQIFQDAFQSKTSLMLNSEKRTELKGMFDELDKANKSKENMVGLIGLINNLIDFVCESLGFSSIMRDSTRTQSKGAKHLRDKIVESQIEMEGGSRL